MTKARAQSASTKSRLRGRASGSPRPGASPSPPRSAALTWTLSLAIVVVAAAIATLFLVREHQIAGRLGFSLDDSWIHAVFARNVATGGGFSFNRGEPVSGSTAPLYTLILALFHAAFGDPVWPAKIWGVLCHAAAAILVFRAALRLGLSPAVSFMAGLLLATSPALLWSALSGMEISTYLLLVAFGLHEWVRGRLAAATLSWSVGLWVRPDGFVLVLVSLALSRRRWLARLAAAAAPAALFLLFNYVVGGTVLPQTVSAKGEVEFDLIGRTLPMLHDWLILWYEPFRWIPGMLFAVLFCAAVALAAVSVSRRQPILALYLVGCPIALSLFRESAGQQLRYIHYVVPFGILLVAAALGRGVRRLPGRWGMAAPVLLAGWVIAQIAVLPGKAESHGWNVQNINSMQRFLGELARAKTLPADVIATNDVGAIGYFSDRKIIDLVGLITPPRSLPDNLRLERPRYLMIFLGWFRGYLRPDSLNHTLAIDEPGSPYTYAAIGGVELKRNTVCAESKMVVFERVERDRVMPRERWLYRN